MISDTQKKNIEKNASEAGVLDSSESDIKNNYTFYNLRFEDPKLALAVLRIELEDMLSKLVESSQVTNGNRIFD